MEVHPGLLFMQKQSYMGTPHLLDCIERSHSNHHCMVAKALALHWVIYKQRRAALHKAHQ
jgi:hypothetical protein